MAFSPDQHKRKKAIICNYGTGGHAEQMRRLLSHIQTKGFILIAQAPTKPADSRYGEYSKISKVRQEYAGLRGTLAIPFLAVAGLIRTVNLFMRYDIRMLISTGPGVAIIPSTIARLFGAKVLYFESWSRFSSPSLAGLIMYRIADVFFVQNEEIRKFYKKARYMGRL
jgi:UDP-N-acetylglucosamine:LPS N-acetylglucosamine transferase